MRPFNYSSEYSTFHNTPGTRWATEDKRKTEDGNLLSQIAALVFEVLLNRKHVWT